VGLRLIGIAAGLVDGGAQEIGAAGNEPEADGLGFYGFLRIGGIDKTQGDCDPQSYQEETNET